MSDANPRPQRVIVLVDASGYGRAAIRMAVRLAHRWHAEIEGLFVEDDELFRLAQLPCTFEVTVTSRSPRPIDAPGVERHLHSMAERVRGELEAESRRHGIGCSFRVMRGRTGRETLAAARRGEVLVLGRGSPSLAFYESRRPLRQHILGVFDETPQALNSLRLAAEWAEDANLPLIPLCAGPADHLQRIRKECRTLCEAEGYQCPSPPITIRSLDDVLRHARRFRAAMLVLPADSPWLAAASIEQLVQELDCPVVLYGPRQLKDE